LSKRDENPRKVLAVASSGGHWVQLLRLRPSWDGISVAYLTTEIGYKEQVLPEPGSFPSTDTVPRFYCVVSANRWTKFRLLKQLFQILVVLLRERPDVIISTGATPGFFAIKFGKLLGARTVWIDSIANAEELSLSGKKIQSSADLWLTQWPHLEATLPGLKYKGSVI